MVKPSLCAGWFRLRSSHLPSLRQVLPGRPAALLHGGPRHRRCNLLEGEPGAAILHSAAVTLMSASGNCATFWSLLLQALSTDSIERLPVYNKTALKNYQLRQEADDWCVPSKEPLDLSSYKVPKWKRPPDGVSSSSHHLRRQVQAQTERLA